MGKHLIFIPVIITLLLSMGGYSLPCLLHCLHHPDMNMEASHMPHSTEKCHHGNNADEKCDGSCMVNSVTNDSSGPDSEPAGALLFTDHRPNLWATASNDIVIPPSRWLTFLIISSPDMHSLWIADPASPPPKSFATA